MYCEYKIESINGVRLINYDGSLFCVSLIGGSVARNEREQFYGATVGCDANIVEAADARLGMGGRLDGVIGLDVLKKVCITCNPKRNISHISAPRHEEFVVSDVVDVLILEPSIGMVFDWGSIHSPVDWMRLLVVRPEFAAHCPINRRWDQFNHGVFELTKPRMWRGATRPIVVIPLGTDIKRTIRADTDGVERYLYSKRVRLEDFRGRGRGSLYDAFQIMMQSVSDFESVSIDGENLERGDSLNATSFVSTLKRWLKTTPSSIKVVYLEYLAGMARCDPNVLGGE